MDDLDAIAEAVGKGNAFCSRRRGITAARGWGPKNIDAYPDARAAAGARVGHARGESEYRNAFRAGTSGI